MYCLWKQAQKMKKTCREGNAFNLRVVGTIKGAGPRFGHSQSVLTLLSTLASSPVCSHRYSLASIPIPITGMAQDLGSLVVPEFPHRTS